MTPDNFKLSDCQAGGFRDKCHFSNGSAHCPRHFGLRISHFGITQGGISIGKCGIVIAQYDISIWKCFNTIAQRGIGIAKKSCVSPLRPPDLRCLEDDLHRLYSDEFAALQPILIVGLPAVHG